MIVFNEHLGADSNLNGVDLILGVFKNRDLY